MTDAKREQLFMDVDDVLSNYFEKNGTRLHLTEELIDLILKQRVKAKQEVFKRIEAKWDTSQFPCGCPEWCTCWEDFKKEVIGGGE